MQIANIKPVVDLFRAAALMEDDIVPTDEVVSEESGQKKPVLAKLGAMREKAHQAIAEKKAMVKRTKVAKISFLLDYNAKPTEFSAADVFDILINPAANHVAVVTAQRSSKDELSVKPDGITVVPVDKILDIKVSGLESVAMAAVYNVALAENKSANAQLIVDTLGLASLVDDIRAQHQLSLPSQEPSRILYLWYPVFGVPLSAYSSALPSGIGPAEAPATPQEDINPSPFAYNSSPDASIPDDKIEHAHKPASRPPEQEPDPSFVPGYQGPQPGATRAPQGGPRA